MRKLLKKALCTFLALLLVFSFTTPALASSNEAAESESASLNISVTADKKKYASDEKIIFTIVVNNSNDYDSKDVKVTTILDFGLKMSDDDEIIEIGDVKAGEKIEKKIEVVSDNNENTANDGVNKAFDIIEKVFSTIRMIIGTILSIFLPNYDSCEIIMNEETVGILCVVKGNVRAKPLETYTVSFDLNYEGAPAAPESQRVVHGLTATEPTAPTRDGYLFIGWTTDPEKQDLSACFDFSSEITCDIPLYGIWAEDVDTDGDGIIDYIESTVCKTDPLKKDTDGDNLTDYFEVMVLGTDPLKKDSDDNGVNDSDEDNDGDSLTNFEEQEKGTSPVLSDTDSDELTDKEEIDTYLTNPLEEDTDEDGINDGDEIALGLNPLEKDSDNDGIIDGDEIFSVTKTAEGENLDPRASPKIEINLAGNQVDTLSITKIDDTDFFLSKDIPGFIGCGYDFNVDGDFDTAQMTFEFDAALLEDPNFTPRIYWFDEENQTLEELPNQTVSGNTVTAEVTHFSKYILCAKEELGAAWDIEIQAQSDNIEVVLLIDSSGSMQGNDPSNIRLSVAQNLVSKLNDDDLVSVFSFDTYPSQKCGFTKDKNMAYSSISNIGSNGYSTYIGSGLSSALSIWSTASEENVNRFLVLLTDGQSFDDFISYSSVANSKDVTIYTVGLGSSVQSGELSSLAAGTGGAYYSAANASALYAIFDNILEQIDTSTDTDEDGISNYHEKKIAAGEVTTGTGIKLLVGEDYSLKTLDWQNADTDGDGLLDGEEIKITPKPLENGETIWYAKFISDPLQKDTDGDGYTDYEEVNGKKLKDGSEIETGDGTKFDPLKWNVSDRDLLICANVVYDNLPIGAKLNQSGKEGSNELKDWKVIATSGETYGEYDSLVGMQAAAYMHDDNIIIAYRGTEFLTEFVNDVVNGDIKTWFTRINVQALPARNFAINVISNYYKEGCKLYITGHSLGGQLAYEGAIAAFNQGCYIQKLDVFNGYGMIYKGDSYNDYNYVLERICRSWGDFTIIGDIVSCIPITCHYGKRNRCVPGLNVLSVHFLDYFYDCKQHFQLTTRPKK